MSNSGKREAVIVAAARTAIGKYAGQFSGFESYQLGGIVIKEAVKRAGIDPSQIDEVYMGNCEGAPGNIARSISAGSRYTRHCSRNTV